MLWLTQIGAHTSCVLRSASTCSFGLGMGFAMMPIFTGAMQSIRASRRRAPRTALNIIQQIGASIGTAVMSVVLATALAAQLGRQPRHDRRDCGGVGRDRAHLAAPMAAAFGQTFWWALALLAVAFVASLALPKRKPQVAGDPAPAPVPL